ncbi:hypothetical protein ACN20G_28325 (plasmid) [Streptomyces sp. BI20]|uniref:hypothetical protein n=1 Tax=Streptomyces sp. BI20 TaxID=3403460 RepID=UPI003C73A005
MRPLSPTAPTPRPRPEPAPAAPVPPGHLLWFRGEHHRVTVSATTLCPGDPLTLTVTAHNDDPEPRALLLRLAPDAEHGNPFTPAGPGRFTGPAPSTCGIGTDGHALVVDHVHTRIAGHTTATVTLHTRIREDAVPGLHTFTPWARSSVGDRLADTHTPTRPALTVLAADRLRPR